jgi:hypothetical protein
VLSCGRLIASKHAGIRARMVLILTSMHIACATTAGRCYHDGVVAGVFGYGQKPVPQQIPHYEHSGSHWSTLVSRTCTTLLEFAIHLL